MSASDFVFDDDARKVILASVGLDSGESADRMIEELETTIAHLMTRFTETGREHSKSLHAIQKKARALKLAMGELTEPADMELIDFFPGGDRQILLDGLADVEVAAENASMQFSTDGRNPYRNTKEAKQMAVRLLLPGFERDYVERSLPKEESKDYWCACYMEPCLRALGITKIPGEERMISDYIRPGRRSWRAELHALKKLAAEAPDCQR